ncbi:MAG: HD domain-containing phosphohydrolase [Planctomycetota bacterium]
MVVSKQVSPPVRGNGAIINVTSGKAAPQASVPGTILFVDDESRVLDSIRRTLRIAEPAWSLHFAQSVSEARHVLACTPIDIVVTDLNMPSESGFDLIRHLRKTHALTQVPVIVLTGVADADIKRRALECGAIDLLAKPIDREDLMARLRSVLRLKHYEDALAHMNATLERQVVDRTNKLEASRTDILLCLAMAGECRDTETGRHVIRVGRYTQLLASAIGLPHEEVVSHFHASPLHDIGKIGVPDGILLKPGPLTDHERHQMESHCVIGHRILTAPTTLSVVFEKATVCPGQTEVSSLRAPNPLLALAAEIALCHHERWDGSGYPRKLRRQEIPISARIVAIADAFDAITSVRPYKPAHSPSTAGHAIRNGAGTQFDPELVNAFTSVEQRFDEVAGALADAKRGPPEE